MKIGPFYGELDAAYLDDGLEAALADLPALLKQNAELMKAGRHHLLQLSLPRETGRALDVVVKSFAGQTSLKNRYDRRYGSKAHRSFLVACHLQEQGIGTPPPVAYLDRWEGRHLAESYYVSLLELDLTDFRKALIHIYRHAPDCADLMALLQRVADAVRGMHEAGVLHRDMGNQNILLQEGPEPGVLFTDLNRARIRDELSEKDRARDVSRLCLCSDLLRIFKEMYWSGPPPRSFDRWERFFRRRYALHDRSRVFRHPVRERALRGTVPEDERYPALRNTWIWDDRSAQPVQVARGRERRRQIPPGNVVRQVHSTLRRVLPLWRTYRSLIKNAYGVPVEMKGRVGVAVEPAAGRWEERRSLLAALGPVPVLVRFYHHAQSSQLDAVLAAVKELHGLGHDVTLALIQDRVAVREPVRWKQFGDGILDAVGECVAAVEVGHAINRTKWGIWSFEDFQGVVAPLVEWRSRYPQIRFTGPAGIDFEYPFVLAALDALPDGASFDGLSHHLYVDRRGAPESRQGPFSALEKMALLRAVAQAHGRCGDHVTCSEVNWPLQGTGIFSPVGSPYNYPGQQVGHPNVSETAYAEYMIRYLLIALCSGFIDRVYWWRLAAHGFGLVSDAPGEPFRIRPAYAALKAFLEQTGTATFMRYRAWGWGGHAYLFRSPNADPFAIVYSTAAQPEEPLPESGVERVDLNGHPITGDPGSWRATGTPVIVRGIREEAWKDL